jgi:DNA-binding transcriptional LysR family regulator
MAGLDLESLSVFEEIYQTGNVSVTADHLGLTRPTVSAILKKLRTHFDDGLFSRTSKGMSPTPRARELYPKIREVMVLLGETKDAGKVFVPAEATRTFRIAMTEINELVLLPVLLNHLSQVAPKVRIESEKILEESSRRLESGETDLVVGFMPRLEAGFYQHTLFTEDFVCLAALNHPRIGAKLGKAAFLQEGHIVVASSGSGHSVADKVMAQQGLERGVMLRLPNFLGVARIVARTELLVVVPRLLGEALASQEAIKLLDPPVALPSYAVKQHWHERFHAEPGNFWLRTTFAELFGRTQTERIGTID